MKVAGMKEGKIKLKPFSPVPLLIYVIIFFFCVSALERLVTTFQVGSTQYQAVKKKQTISRLVKASDHCFLMEVSSDRNFEPCFSRLEQIHLLNPVNEEYEMYFLLYRYLVILKTQDHPEMLAFGVRIGKVNGDIPVDAKITDEDGDISGELLRQSIRARFADLRSRL